MSKHTLVISQHESIIVEFKPHQIKITGRVFDMHEVMQIVNKEFANELRYNYPQDYGFIVDDEEYYDGFLCLGSPQFMELGWVLNYKVEANKTTLTISNLEQ